MWSRLDFLDKRVISKVYNEFKEKKEFPKRG
jgi:hypothetical protein